MERLHFDGLSDRDGKIPFGAAFGGEGFKDLGRWIHLRLLSFSEKEKGYSPALGAPSVR